MAIDREPGEARPIFRKLSLGLAVFTLFGLLVLMFIPIDILGKLVLGGLELVCIIVLLTIARTGRLPGV
jgi:hypothetical protein